MNDQITSLLFVGLTFCTSLNAKPSASVTNTEPKGIHVDPETRLRVVSYNGYGVQRGAILLNRQDRVEKIDHLPVFMDLK
jgi:hypothetical protein